MRKTSLLKPLFLLFALIVGLGSAWAQSDYSTDYTGNVTLSTYGGTKATACVIKISNTDYDGIKAGTTSAAGAMLITVPSGTKYLHLHLAGWNGETVTLGVTPTGYSDDISLTANSGISGNSPFTFSGDPSTDDYYKVITFASALTADTDLTFTAKSGKRFVVWGVTAEEDGGSTDPSVATTVTIDDSGLTNTNLFDGTAAGQLTATVSAGENVISGATVTWSSSEEDVATIDANGVVTLVDEGTTTITASYAGVANQYKPSSKTYTLTVINEDPNAKVLWSEDFGNYSSGDAPSGGTYNYVCANGGSTTKIYNEALAGGTAPELLVSKTGGSFEATIDLQNYYGNMTLSFKSNNGNITVSADGGTLGDVTVDDVTHTHTYPVTVEEGTDNLKLTFTNSVSSNSRVDDFLLKGGQESTNIKENTTIEFKDATSATITTLSLNINETADVTVTCSAPGVTPTIENSDPSVATYENGTVTALKGGTTTITASFAGNDNYKSAEATLTITVTDPNANDGSAEHPFTVVEARAYIESLGGEQSPKEVYVHGIITKVDSYNSNYKSITYWIADDINSGENMEVYSGKGLDGADFNAITDLSAGDIVTVKGYVKLYGVTPEFTSNSEIVSYQGLTVIHANNVELEWDATSGEIPYTITNPISGTTLSVSYNPNDAYWISNVVITDEKVTFTTTANEDNQQRYTDITLRYEGAEDVVVRVTQKYNVPDYATLPFVFDGGKDQLAGTFGLTQSGLGTDYANSPKLKFDGSGDYVVLKVNEAPTSVSFLIQGNSFSGGTFKVHTSADGETYTDIATYTELGSVAQTKIINNIAADVHYIKWLYVTKVTGNVGLGNIVVRTEAMVTMNQYGWATFSCNKALDFTGSGLEAYIITDHVGTTDITKKAVTKVPANTGLLLKGEEQGLHLVGLAYNGTENVTGNCLKPGTGEEVQAESDKTKYMLTVRDDKAVFAVISTYAPVIEVGKAYLEFNGTVEAAAFNLDLGETTGISAIENAQMTDGNVYNLNGQRVAQPTKGLYIVNGKKVVIK